MIFQETEFILEYDGKTTDEDDFDRNITSSEYPKNCSSDKLPSRKSSKTKLSEIKILHGGEAYGTAPKVLINNKEVDFLEASLLDGQVEKVVLNTSVPEAYKDIPLSISFSGGNLENPAISPGDVDPFNYKMGILIMALITGAYVIIGGLKAVIITDVIQSVLLLLARLLVAFITCLLYTSPSPRDS